MSVTSQTFLAVSVVVIVLLAISTSVAHGDETSEPGKSITLLQLLLNFARNYIGCSIFPQWPETVAYAEDGLGFKSPIEDNFCQNKDYIPLLGM